MRVPRGQQQRTLDNGGELTVHDFRDSLSGDVDRQVRLFRCFILHTDPRQSTQFPPPRPSVHLSTVGHLGVFQRSGDMDMENVRARSGPVEHGLQELVLILPLRR